MKQLQFIVFCFAALILTTSSFAQQNGRREQPNGRNFQQTEKKEEPKRLSAKEIAKYQTEQMNHELSLTEKQYKKIYKIYLADAQAAESNASQERNGSMGRPPMGGGMSQMGGGRSSMGQGGQSMGQGRQSMGQDGQSMGQDGQSMGEGRPSMQNGDNTENHLDLEKLAAKKEAKIKKILTPEQYVLWIGIEKEKQRKEFWDMKPMPAPEKRVK
jgi:hypothetical protein